MNWISNVVPPKIRSILKRDTPENLWVKCPDSGQLVFHKDLAANLYVVPGSGYHMRCPAKERLTALFDNGSFEEIATPEVPSVKKFWPRSLEAKKILSRFQRPMERMSTAICVPRSP